MKIKKCLYLLWVASGLLVSGIANAQTNLVLLVSRPGEYIGGGQTFRTTNTSDFGVQYYRFGSQTDIEVTAFGYDMFFAGPGGADLTAGTYTNAALWPLNGSAPGLSISGNGRSCNTVCGNFRIWELGTDSSGNLAHLWLTFTQHCECSTAPLTGEIRYHSQLARPLGPGPRTLLVPYRYPTIQAAMDDASLFGWLDTILVAPGIYNESVDFKGKAVHLMSAAGPSATFIQPPAGSPAVVFRSGETSNSVVSGFTFTNGGVSVSFSSPTIISNVLVNCGTGVDGTNTGANMLYNLITGCSGDAIHLEGGLVSQAGTLIAGNVIENNGGGISMVDAVYPHIINNLIQGNQGDGLSMVGYSSPDIIQNLIIGNAGDGISWQGLSGRGPALGNDTIAGNGGAAISADGSWALIDDSILVGNPALFVGGTNVVAPPDFILQSSDVYSATGGAYAGSISNLTGVAGNISADPLFACPATGDYRLAGDSPCIDAGAYPGVDLVATDFGGNPRLLAGHTNGPAILDIGAYEADPSAPVVPCGSTPTMTCPDPLTVECGTPATLTVQASEPDGAALTVLWSVNGTVFQTNTITAGTPPTTAEVSFTAELPLGTNLVEIVAANSMSNSAYCSTTVTVVDTTPPTIRSAGASPDLLWPPNHKLVIVTLHAAVGDNCGPATWKVIKVQSNEPTHGRGDGNTAPDWRILDDHKVALCAERSGRGSGRVYTMTLQAEDVAGNLSTPRTVTVTVPKSMGKR